MKEYKGVSPEDRPMHGGSFIEYEGWGAEIFNFLPLNGMMYGFVEAGYKPKLCSININRLGAIFVALFTGAVMPVDKEQLIRASLVTNPVYIDENDKSKCQTSVRVTFQRVVTNTQNQITRLECIEEPKIYQEFFDKLSQSLFLEAHEI